MIQECKIIVDPNYVDINQGIEQDDRLETKYDWRWNGVSNVISRNNASGNVPVDTPFPEDNILKLGTSSYLAINVAKNTENVTINLSKVYFKVELEFSLYKFNETDESTIFVNSLGYFRLYIDRGHKVCIDYYSTNDRNKLIKLQSTEQLELDTPYKITAGKIPTNDSSKEILFIEIVKNSNSSNPESNYYSLTIKSPNLTPCNRPLRDYVDNLNQDLYHITRIGSEIEETFSNGNYHTNPISPGSNVLFGYLHYFTLYTDRFKDETEEPSTDPDEPSSDDTGGEEQTIIGDKYIKHDLKRKIYYIMSPIYNSEGKYKTKRNVIKNVVSEAYIKAGKDTTDEEEEAIGTLDDGDIILEVADKTVFFIELVPDTNTLNLYRKDNLIGRSILVSSISHITGTPLNFDNVWTHIAITYDKTTSELTLYVGGKKAFTTTDIKGLDPDYIQFNTFKVGNKATYFGGIQLTHNVKYNVPFFPNDIKASQFPRPLLIFSGFRKTIVRRPRFYGPPNAIVTTYKRVYPRRLVKIYANYIPNYIYGERIIYSYPKIHVRVVNIRTYYRVPYSNVIWRGGRIIGPYGLVNGVKVRGYISLFPPITLKTIRHYAPSWTLKFWGLRYNTIPSAPFTLLKIRATHGYFKFVLRDKTINTLVNGKVVKIIKGLPNFKYDVWTHFRFIYNDIKEYIVIYINGVAVHRFYIKLYSPLEYILDVGTDPDDGMYYSDIELKDEAEDEKNQIVSTDPDDPNADEKPEKEEESYFTFDTHRNIEGPPKKDIMLFSGGLDIYVIDYRLPMYLRSITNLAFIKTGIRYDIVYNSTIIDFNRIVIIHNHPDIWDQIRVLAPQNINVKGNIFYKSIGEKLYTYTIDFWVFKENNYIKDDDLSLFTIIGNNNKVRVILTDTEFKYLVQRNNKWVIEKIIPNQVYLNRWSHIAFQFDIVSKVSSVFINGIKIYESITFIDLPLDELYLYTNTIGINTQIFTSIRISKTIRYPKDSFDTKLVDHPYGRQIDFDTERDFQKIVEREKEFRNNITRNVVIGTNIPPKVIIPPEPMSGTPAPIRDYKDRGHKLLPFTDTRRLVAGKVTVKFDTEMYFGINVNISFDAERIKKCKNVNIRDIIYRITAKNVTIRAYLTTRDESGKKGFGKKNINR